MNRLAFILIAAFILPWAVAACDPVPVEVLTDTGQGKELPDAIDAAAEDEAGDALEEALPPETWVRRLLGIRGYAVIEKESGGIVVAGVFTVGGDNNDIVVFEMTSEGDIVWVRTLGGDVMEWAGALAETSEGGVIVAGNSFDFLGTGDSHLLVFRLDAAGDLVWQEKIEGPGMSGSAPAGDGGMLIAGRQAFALKVDADGAVAWQKLYTGDEEESILAIAPAGDGGYFIAGQSYPPESYDYEHDPVWLARLDSGGDISWCRETLLFAGEGCCGLAAADDGGVFLATTDPESMYHVLRFSSSGEPLFSRAMTASSGYSYFSLSVLADGEGGIVVGGGGIDEIGDSNSAWLLGIDGRGELRWQTMVSTSCGDTVTDLAPASGGAFLAVAPDCYESHLVRLGLDGGFTGSCSTLTGTAERLETAPLTLRECAFTVEEGDFTTAGASFASGTMEMETETLCSTPE